MSYLKKEQSLFRKEVMDSQRNTDYGSVSINTPIQYTVLTLGFSLIVFLILLFVMFAEFSEQFIVTGYLNSTKGIVRVYPNKNGIIIRSTVSPGMSVKKGDSLFFIDTSYEGLDNENHHEVLEQLQKRKRAIEKEITNKTQQLYALKPLLLKKYIALSAYQEKEEELTRLEHQNNLIEMDIIKHQQDNAYTIRAPIDGVISSINYKEGQYTNLSKPLLKILPAEADLVAELFIPVRQSGFLNPDNKIIIRYDAYPYERFGTYKAAISHINQTIMTDEEEEKPLVIGQPYYKIIATLDSQFVTLYGKQKKVQHGMTISAVIIGSKRKIWQWILDPLYSFYGGLVT